MDKHAKRLTDEQRAAIIVDVRQGSMTFQEVADRHDVDKKTVGRVAARAGLARNPSRAPVAGGKGHLRKEALAALNADILSGKYTADELREKHHISTPTVKRWMDRAATGHPAVSASVNGGGHTVAEPMTTPRMVSASRKQSKDDQLARLTGIVQRLAVKYPTILTEIL